MKQRMGLYAAGLLLAACTDKADDTDPDTDTDLDTDTQFVCDGVPFSGVITVDDARQPPSVAVTVGLFAVVLGDDIPELGEARWKAEASSFADGEASFALCLPAEGGDDADYTAPEEGEPDFEIATYYLGAWVDVDGDGISDAGEPLVGGSLTLPTHARGTLPADSPIDAEIGWNTLTIDFNAPAGEDEPDLIVTSIEPDGVDAFELSANLVPALYDELPVTIIPDLDEADVDLDLWWFPLGEGASAPSNTTLATTSVDASDAMAMASWTSGVDAPPPVDHTGIFGDGDGPVVLRAAIYTGLAYIDSDDSGAYNSGDRILGASSGASPAKNLLWIEPTQLLDGLFVDAFGFRVGWSLIDFSDEALTPYPWNDGMEINFAGR